MPNEAVGMARAGCVEHALAGRDDCISPTVVDIARSEQGDAGVVVALVVPVDELGDEGPGFLEDIEAGRHLGISPRTIEDHRANIMKKLGARNAADLVRIVMTTQRQGQA